MKLIKKTKLSILTASLLFGLTSNAWGALPNATQTFGGTYYSNNTDGNTTDGFTITKTSCDSISTTGSSFYFGTGTLQDSNSYYYCELTWTADDTDLGTFNLDTFTWQNFAANNANDVDVNITATSGGVLKTKNQAGGTPSTYNIDLSSDGFSDISSFTIRFTTHRDSNTEIANFDIQGMVLSNLKAPSSNTTPTFINSSPISITVNEDSTNNDITEDLNVSDSDSSQTIVWGEKIAPSKGSLTLTSATASSGSTNIKSGGTITYTPTADLNGSDTFDINVSDGSATASVTVNVTINNVNDNPVITSNSGGTTASINVAENSTTVTTVTSTDIDSDIISYSKSGTDSAKFTINSSTGVLTFTSALDYETPTDAGANNVYELNVTATDNGTSNLTDVQDIAVTITNIDETPASPTNLVVKTVNNSDLNLTWDNVANEIGYKIYSSLTGGSGTYELNQTINTVDTTTYSFSNIPTDMQYYFTVSAYNGDGESNSSAENNVTAPTAPTGLSAVDLNSSQIDLSWSDASSTESGYKIYKSTTNGSGYGTAIANLSAGVTEYNVTSLIENTPYYFRVTAYNNGLESNTSVSATTNAVPSFSFLTDPSLIEDFGTDTSLIISNLTDSNSDDINLSVENNDSSLITFSKSWTNDLTFAQYNGQTLTITLNSEANASGVAELNVSAYDGKDLVSNVFNVTVTAVNDTPYIVNHTTPSVTESTSKIITNTMLSANDPDNNTTLTYTLTQTPTYGTLSLNGSSINTSGTFTQTDINNADVNYTHTGTSTGDGFKFKVEDQSSTETSIYDFNLTIVEVNDMPTFDINMTDINLSEDSSEFNLSIYNIIDQENADLNISVESNDSSILSYTLSWGDSNLTSANYGNKDLNISIIPVENANGTAELNVTIWDGTNRVSKDFNVTLSAVNDTPTIDVNNTLTVQEAKGGTITTSYLSSSDIDNVDSTLIYTITTSPSYGILHKISTNTELNASVNTTFTQADIGDINYTNTVTTAKGDGFSFKVSDGTLDSVVVDFNITITEVNDPPTYDINMTDINLSEDFSDFNISLINITDSENRDLNITVESNDSTIVNFTQNWSTNISNSTYIQDLNITLLPVTNAYGIAELNVTVDDGVNEVTKDFNITIYPIDDNPTITTMSNISKDMNFSEFNITLNIADVDLGDVNLTVDANDTSLVEFNQTWYDSTNDYNLTYSEYNNRDINLTIISKPNVEGIVRFTLTLEDNQSGEVNTIFDLNVSAYPLILADLNAISLTSPTTTNLTLPTLGTTNSSVISWATNNSTTITNTGTLTQGTSDVIVTLTASVNLADTTLTKDFSITVTGTGSLSSSSGGGTTTYVASVTNDQESEPTVEESVNDEVIEEDTIIIIDSDTNEEVVVINEVDTNNQIETYGDFSENEDGTNTATVDFVDGSGKVTQTEIKTDFAKEDVIITSTDAGVETKAQVNNENGSKTESKTKVNNNGTLTSEIKVTDKDGNEVKTKISSTKVGTNVEMGKDGSLKTSFKDNHGMEVKAVATANGDTEHEIDITDGNGNVVKTVAKSNVKGSNVVIKDDGSVQTSVHTTSTITNQDGSKSEVEVLSVVEANSEGKATHVMQVTDSEGNAIVTKAQSEILGATTTIAESGIETTATATTTFTDNSGEIQNRELQFKVEAKPSGQANHKLSFKDENGQESITEATSEVKGAITTIKTDNTIETKANVLDSQGNRNEVIAQALSNGDATHSLESRDENGNSIKVEATSELPNTKTVIKDSGVETSTTTTNENSEKVDIKVTGTKEGYAKHEVTVNENNRGQLLSTRSTFAQSQVKGAKTLINKSGLVQTMVSIKSNGIITQAFVDTTPNGESHSYFKKFDSNGAELETQSTTKNSNFELGNNAIIKEKDGNLLLDITTRVSSGKTIEF